MGRRLNASTCAALLLLSLTTTGCGDGDAAEDSGDAAREVELEVFSWWVAPGEAEALHALFDLHRQNYPNESIYNAVEQSGTMAKQELSDRLAAGEPPDLFQQNAYEMKQLLADHPGTVEQLDELFSQEGLTTAVAPEVLDSITVDGHIYSVPVNAHRENSLFYNAAIFAELGLEPPATLEQFLSTCEALDAAGITPVAVSTSQSWIISKLFIGVASGAMGARKFHAYFSGNEAMDEALFGESVDVLDTVLTNYIDVDQAAAEGFGWTQAAEAVFDGEAAMFLHGDWAKGYFAALGWTPNVDFGVVGSPGASELFLYGSDVFGIPVGAKHSEAALHFASTIASIEGQIAFNMLKGSSPIRLDVPQDDFDALSQQVIADFKDAEIRMPLLWQNAWDEALAEFATTHDREALIQAFRDTPPTP
jgi:glucose/mannose transport system substrate-binding protein